MFDYEGNVVSSTMFVNDKEEGESIAYCERENIIMLKDFYENGKLHGLRTEYYCITGKVRCSVEYKNGKIMKVQELNDIRGNKLFSGNNAYGQGTFLKYDSLGVLTDSFFVTNGYKDGYHYMITNTGHVDSTFYKKGVSEYGIEINIY